MISLYEQIQPLLSSFGARLQKLRLQRCWTLQDLADRSGLSKAFLSRLESGDRQASIAAVLTLSRIFGVSLGSLFESGPDAEPCVIVRKNEAVEQTTNGLSFVPLTGSGGAFHLQPLRVRIPGDRRGDEHFHHEGEEWIYVLTGKLALSLAGTVYELDAGDAVHFDSQIPHRLIAREGRDVEVLLVASPLRAGAKAEQPQIREWSATSRTRAAARPRNAPPRGRKRTILPSGNTKSH